MFKLLTTLYVLILSISIGMANSDFENAQETIEIRKTAMQALWIRVKRLAPYVELNEQIDYGKDIAEQDAKEIQLLLRKTKSMWSNSSNLSGKGFTNANPSIWALPDYFKKLYNDAEQSANNLIYSIEKDNIEKTELAMCNLGKACGTCHANFRRLLTTQLANEVSGWSGQYIKSCN